MFSLPVFNSPLEVVVFSVFYDYDLISLWTSAHNSLFTAPRAVRPELLVWL